MANIITELHLEMSSNWYVTKKLNSIGRVGENTVTKLIIEPTEIINDVTYEIEIMGADGSKNVAELTVEGSELYLILTANMLTTSGITKMQVRATFEDGSIKKSNIFELKVNRSISATEAYEEYAVTIFDQLVAECRDIIEGAESYAVRAETAAVNAEAYEQSASASAEAASASEATATSASTAAVNAAASAESASTSAHTSAETATTAAASASTSATTATTSAQTAQTASVTAQSASETAVNASTAATTAASNAASSATSAATSANNASASATSAASSAANAASSETNASASASNAAASETNASASATAANTSATSASTSATNATNSAVAAATSATNAHNSEVNASTSETNASTSATEAAASAESIAASVAQINENTYRINDLEAIIAGYQLTDLPTGAVATITDGTTLLMPSLKVGIEPVQDLHGYDHPWAGGTGKNLLENKLTTQTINGVTATVKDDGTIVFTGTATQSSNFFLNTVLNLQGSYVINGCPSDGSDSTYYINVRANGSWGVKDYGNGVIVNYVTITNIAITVANGYAFPSGGLLFKPMIRLATVTDSTFEPYSNICPISGWTEANIAVSPTTDAEDGTTYTIEFKDGDNPLTVYGGTLDVTSGELTVTDAYITSYNGEALPSTWISDRDVYAEGATPTTGAEVVYELATPQTYHLTPTQVRTLVGNNNIWVDTGNIIEGKYFRSLV